MSFDNSFPSSYRSSSRVLHSDITWCSVSGITPHTRQTKLSSAYLYCWHSFTMIILHLVRVRRHASLIPVSLYPNIIIVHWIYMWFTTLWDCLLFVLSALQSYLCFTFVSDCQIRISCHPFIEYTCRFTTLRDRPVSSAIVSFQSSISYIIILIIIVIEYLLWFNDFDSAGNKKNNYSSILAWIINLCIFVYQANA